MAVRRSMATPRKEKRPGDAPGLRVSYRELRQSSAARGPLAIDFGALFLAQADRVRRDLDQLVVGDELQRLLERHLDRRDQAFVVVLAGSAEVGQLLGAQGV